MNSNTTKLYPVYNIDARHIGNAASASRAGEILGIDALMWDDSGRPIQVTLSNVGGQFAWTDTRLATATLLPLLKLDS